MSFPVPGETEYAPEMGVGESDVTAQRDPLLPGRMAEAVDYSIKLDEDAQQRLARRLCAEYEHYESVIKTRRDNAKVWRDAAKMMPDTATGEDWQSDARAAFTRLACQNHTTRLNQQLLTPDPLFTAVARKQFYTSPEQPGLQVPLAAMTPQIETALMALLEEADYQRVARRVHRELPVVSPCAVRVQWKQESIRVPVLQIINDLEETVLLMEAGVDPEEAYLAPVETGKDGLAKLNLALEDRVVKDGVDLAMIPFERLVLFPATAETRDGLWGVGERLMLRGMALERGVEDGVYLKEAVENILKQQGDGLTEAAQDAGDRSGIDTPTGATAQIEGKYQEYDCIELCLLDDLNDDGANEWYIVTVHLGTQTLLRCQLSPYEHGRPYYHVFAYIEDTLLGESVAELVAVLQDQANACLQQITDLAEWEAGTAGAFFYDRTSGYNPDRHIVEPGMPIPVDNVNGITPFVVGQNIPQAIQHLMAFHEQLKVQNDLLTASSNPSLGRDTEGDKTLGEVQLVAQAAAGIFEDYSRQVALDWAAVADLVRLTAAQYADKGQVEVRSTAAPEPVFQTIPADLLKADLDLVPAGLGGYSDLGARLQRDLLVINTLVAQPLVQQQPTIQADLLRQFLQDVRWPNWQGISDKIGQAAAMQEQAMLMQQAMMMAGGIQQQQMGADAHAADMQDRTLARTEKVGNMLAVEPPAPNGNGKKAAKK